MGGRVTNNNVEGEISLFEICGVLNRYNIHIFIVTLLCLMIGIGRLYLFVPLYEAKIYLTLANEYEIETINNIVEKIESSQGLQRNVDAENHSNAEKIFYLFIRNIQSRRLKNNFLLTNDKSYLKELSILDVGTDYATVSLNGSDKKRTVELLNRYIDFVNEQTTTLIKKNWNKKIRLRKKILENEISVLKEYSLKELLGKSEIFNRILPLEKEYRKLNFILQTLELDNEVRSMTVDEYATDSIEIKPKTTKILVFSLLIGLSLGIALAFLLDAMKKE